MLGIEYFHGGMLEIGKAVLLNGERREDLALQPAPHFTSSSPETFSNVWKYFCLSQLRMGMLLASSA